MELYKNELETIYKILKKEKVKIESEQEEGQIEEYNMIKHLVNKFEMEGNVKKVFTFKGENNYTNEVLKKYVNEIVYEELKPSELTSDKIDSLWEKEGLVVRTNTTNLWITKKLSFFKSRGEVSMSSFDYTVKDDSGTLLLTGGTWTVIDFVEEFLEKR